MAVVGVGEVAVVGAHATVPVPPLLLELDPAPELDPELELEFDPEEPELDSDPELLL